MQLGFSIYSAQDLESVAWDFQALGFRVLQLSVSGKNEAESPRNTIP